MIVRRITSGLARFGGAIALICAGANPCFADGHAMGAVVLGYEQPSSSALRIDALGWRDMFAMTENVVMRIQAAPLRLLSFGSFEKPALTDGQRTTVWQCDFGTLPVVFGPIAVGAVASIGETNSLVHRKAVGDYGVGKQSAMGLGGKVIGALHIKGLGGASAAWGPIWHFGGMRQLSSDVTMYLVLNQANMYGLVATYALSDLRDASGFQVARGSSWTLSLGLVRDQ